MTAQLTLEDAAALACVSVGTVRNWINMKMLTAEMIDGAYRVDAATLRGSKLLREKALLARAALREAAIEQADLAQAIECGAVVPIAGSPRLFSLNDADELLRWKRGEWIAPTQVEDDEPRASDNHDGEVVEVPADDASVPLPGDESHSTHLDVRSSGWPVLVRYITEHRDPYKLPRWYWDTRTCPEFVPPAGVFRYIYWYLFNADAEGNPCTGIKRSQGWRWDKQQRKLSPVPEDECFDCEDEVTWPPGREPPKYAKQNLRWRHLRADWQQAWFQRRGELRAQGIDPLSLPIADTSERRDRRAILLRYREEHWAPCDLPDWYWDTDPCPPFEAPTWVSRFEYGEPAHDPAGSGKMGTWIRWRGMWQHPIGDRVFFEPVNDQLEWEPSVFEEGTVPAQYEENNHEYDLAVMEWQEEYRMRQKRRRGEE